MYLGHIHVLLDLPQQCPMHKHRTGTAVQDVRALKTWDPGDPLGFPAGVIDSSAGAPTLERCLDIGSISPAAMDAWFLKT